MMDPVKLPAEWPPFGMDKPLLLKGIRPKFEGWLSPKSLSWEMVTTWVDRTGRAYVQTVHRDLDSMPRTPTELAMFERTGAIS